MVRGIWLPLLHAVTPSIDGDHLRMVKKPIEKSGCKHFISPKNCPPSCKAGVGGENNRTMLVASCYQLKKVMSLLKRELGIAYLIDNQHIGRYVATETLTYQPWVRGSIKRLCKLRKRRKEHRVTCGEGSPSQRETQVRFPDSWRSQKDD